MARYQTPESLGRHLAEVVKAFHPTETDRVLKAATLTRSQRVLLAEANPKAETGPTEHPDFANLKPRERRDGRFASFFIDLSNFTARSVFQPPTELADFTELVLSAFWEAVEDHGGYVLDIRGDGLLAGFGGVDADATTEIDRGLRAAAFCLAATRDTLNPELVAAGIDPTDVKVSGDWGEVLATRVGSRINYLGSSINLAGKLEKFADEFTIVVGDGLATEVSSAIVTEHPDSPYELTYSADKVKKYSFYTVTWESPSRSSVFGETPVPRRVSGGSGQVGLLKAVRSSAYLGVSPDGRLVSSALAAPTVTVVAPHRNDGVVQAPEFPASIAWWAVMPEVLERERKHMARAFPGFDEFERDGRVGWRGRVHPWRRDFEIAVVWRWDHSQIPTVWVTSEKSLGRWEASRWVRPHHIYKAGNLCIAREADWKTDVYDATTAIAWAVHWLATYEQWALFGGGWPRAGHGLA